MRTVAADSKEQARLLAWGDAALTGPRRYFCTYFDSRYVSQGLALYHSLLRHVGDFELWILCFDQLAYDALAALRLSQVRLVSLEEFERDDAGLLEAKPTRSAVEYIFTCSPSWPLYVLRHSECIDVLAYVDADLCFFSSPEPLYAELGCGPLLITAHGFPTYLKWFERYGRFNMGLMLFRHDETALCALSWWRDRCLEWCYERVEESRFADQKYLDQWPALFPDTRVLSAAAGALAPWNWMNYEILWNRDHITVNGEELVTYHFQSVSLHWGHLYTTVLSQYGRMPGSLRRRIHGAYIHDVAKMENLVCRTFPRRQWPAAQRARLPRRPWPLLKAWCNGDIGVRIL